MAANDKLSSNGVKPVSQVPMMRVLEFYDPAAYLAAAYPVVLPPVEARAAAVVEAAAEAQAETVAPASSLVDRSREHSRRAAQALAEVHSTARERGLLKAPPTVQVAAVASAGPLDTEALGDDVNASTSDRLLGLANWLTREGDISGLFLLDERGYSLLPESDGSVGDDVTLHDLGLRLAAVLDLVPQRLELAAEDFQKEAPVARMSLDGGRSLAVMRIVAQGALLAWIESSSMPLAASLAKLAKTRLVAILTDSGQEDEAAPLLAACSDAP